MNAASAIFAVAISFAGLTCASAASPSTIMGKWIERFGNGRGMITEILPTSIASYPIDETGKAMGKPNRSSVTYKDLGGDDVAVVFSAESNGGVLIHRKSADTIVLDFPGVGAHNLMRLPSN